MSPRSTRTSVGSRLRFCDGKLPVFGSPARSSAFVVVAIPFAPWSSEWFEAWSHASQPLFATEAARSGGVRNTGYPVGEPGASGVSTWQKATSASAT